MLKSLRLFYVITFLSISFSMAQPGNREWLIDYNVSESKVNRYQQRLAFNEALKSLTSMFEGLKPSADTYAAFTQKLPLMAEKFIIMCNALDKLDEIKDATVYEAYDVFSKNSNPHILRCAPFAVKGYERTKAFSEIIKTIDPADLIKAASPEVIAEIESYLHKNHVIIAGVSASKWPKRYRSSAQQAAIDKALALVAEVEALLPGINLTGFDDLGGSTLVVAPTSAERILPSSLVITEPEIPAVHEESHATSNSQKNFIVPPVRSSGGQLFQQAAKKRWYRRTRTR